MLRKIEITLIYASLKDKVSSLQSNNKIPLKQGNIFRFQGNISDQSEGYISRVLSAFLIVDLLSVMDILVWRNLLHYSHRSPVGGGGSASLYSENNMIWNRQVHLPFIIWGVDNVRLYMRNLLIYAWNSSSNNSGNLVFKKINIYTYKASEFNNSCVYPNIYGDTRMFRN